MNGTNEQIDLRAIERERRRILAEHRAAQAPTDHAVCRFLSWAVSGDDAEEPTDEWSLAQVPDEDVEDDPSELLGVLPPRREH